MEWIRKHQTDAVTADHTDKHVLITDAAGGEVTVAEGATPYILTVNGLKNDWTLTGATFSGEMRLIKQGQAALTFSGEHTYTGVTELWEGVTNFEGSLQSPVWVNRFAELNTSAIYNKGIDMEYGAILRVGSAANQPTVTASTLNLKKGAVVELDIYSDNVAADKLVVNDKLTLADGAVFRCTDHCLFPFVHGHDRCRVDPCVAGISRGALTLSLTPKRATSAVNARYIGILRQMSPRRACVSVKCRRLCPPPGLPRLHTPSPE